MEWHRASSARFLKTNLPWEQKRDEEWKRKQNDLGLKKKAKSERKSHAKKKARRKWPELEVLHDELEPNSSEPLPINAEKNNLRLSAVTVRLTGKISRPSLTNSET